MDPPVITAGPGQQQMLVANRGDERRAMLVVLRGEKVGIQYPVYDGENYIGRADELPVDIDLDDQEPNDRVWSSRQHAKVTCQNAQLFVEDLNSANGTYVNRVRVLPGRKQPLAMNDVLQIGTVQLKLLALTADGKSEPGAARVGRLIVRRGLKTGVVYPLYEGRNYLGRADDVPVDVDFDDQESPDRVWTSRQHALITSEKGQLFIEDLNSANGTYVNRSKVKPGERKPLKGDDIIQVGTVHLKLEL